MTPLLTIDDLDRLFAAKPQGKKAKPSSKPTLPPAPSPRYWIPDAVVLWESQWSCQCGCSGPATPELFVRERSGRATRLRAIRSPHQFSLLPRITEIAEPSQVHVCPNCFSGASEYVACQLPLPFPEEQELFRTRVKEAVDWASELDRMLEPLEESGPPPRRTSRETPLPRGYEFIPQDIRFDENTPHPTQYLLTVATEDGPGFPHCIRSIL